MRNDFVLGGGQPKWTYGSNGIWQQLVVTGCDRGVHGCEGSVGRIEEEGRGLGRRTTKVNLRAEGEVGGVTGTEMGCERGVNGV